MGKKDNENDALFEEERDLQNVLNYYEKKYKENIGIMFAAVETDDLEVDLIVGTDSDRVLGMRLIQYVPAETDEGAEDQPPMTKGKQKAPAAKADESADDADDEDAGDDDEDELLDVIIYDFTKVDDLKAKVKGKSVLEFEVGAPKSEEGEDEGDTPPEKPAPKKKSLNADKAEDEEKYWVHIAVFLREDDEGEEFTGAVLHYIDKPQTKIVFLPNPDIS